MSEEVGTDRRGAALGGPGTRQRVSLKESRPAHAWVLSSPPGPASRHLLLKSVDCLLPRHCAHRVWRPDVCFTTL